MARELHVVQACCMAWQPHRILLRLLRDRYIVLMIMELVSNHSFALTNGNDKRKRQKRSHKDLSWYHFSSTSTPLTCQPPSPGSMNMVMTQTSCMLLETGRQWKPGPVLSLCDRFHQIGSRASSGRVTVWNFLQSKRGILSHNSQRTLYCFYPVRC